MKALKCDICGSFYDCSFYDYDERKTGITGFAFINVNNSVVGDCNDICPGCLAAIKKALDDRKKARLKKCSD